MTRFLIVPAPCSLALRRVAKARSALVLRLAVLACMTHLSEPQRSDSPVSPLSRPRDSSPSTSSAPHPSSSSSSLARARTPAHESQEQRRRQVEDLCGHVRLVRDGERPAFELLVLVSSLNPPALARLSGGLRLQCRHADDVLDGSQGCGGGPIETNLSSFLLKPYDGKWTDGCTGLEGALRLLFSPPPGSCRHATASSHLVLPALQAGRQSEPLPISWSEIRTHSKVSVWV